MERIDSPIQEIKSRLNIVDMIREYAPSLKQAGSNYKALCPFHHEKTPSFTVSEDRQMWYCFGACSEGGDIFDFVQKMEGIDFPEALRILAKRANVVLKKQDPKLITQRTRLLDLLAMAARFYEGNLGEAMGAFARRYAEGRGLKETTLRYFQVGYSPKSWDATKEHLISQGFGPKEVEMAGLSIPRERGSGSYDRFRDRLMFPICDAQGSVLGFGGRRLRDDKEEEGAKYINSPQTLLYDKSKLIFGLSKAKQEIREKKCAILVEGYLDVLTCHQAGFKNVVAVSGTALTQEQVNLLKRFAPTLILAFDTDAAGLDAVNRGVDNALQSEMNVLVASFQASDGKDPDEMIRKDCGIFAEGIQRAKPFVDYYFDRTLSKTDLSNVVQKKQVASILLAVIAKLQDPVERSHYLQRLAFELSVKEEVILQAFRRKHGFGGGRTPERSVQRASVAVVGVDPHKKFDDLASQLLGFALMKRNFIPHLVASLDPETFQDPVLQRLAKKLTIEYTKNEQFTLNDLLVGETSEEISTNIQKDLVNRLVLVAEDSFSHLSEDEQEREFLTLMARLKRQTLRQTLNSLSRNIKIAEQAGDAEGLERLTKEFEYLTSTLAQLDPH